MDDVMKVFLSLSRSGSLMILILLLCRHFWKDRISRQWQYYIWLIVVARLLLPFAPETNLMGHIFQAVGQTSAQMHSMQAGQQEPGTLHTSDSPSPKGQSETKQPMQSPGSQPIKDIVTLLADHIWLIWLVTALILLIRKITIYQSFVRYVKSGQNPVSDVELLDQLSCLAGQAGITVPIELCVNPLISSPLLIGFFQPYIVLPDTDISEKDFQYIALHELTHYKRRDMFFKWLVQITVCLHWFNPLVYLMSRELSRACELSCDEAVISDLDFRDAKDYGKTLLDAMAKSGSYRESLASVTLSENKELLKERLGAIMKYKKRSKLLTAFSLAMTVTLLCTAAFTGAYAASSDDGMSSSGTENGGGSAADTVVLNLSNKKGESRLLHSSGFQAGDGQVLTLEIKSDIVGFVDLFLFSPSHEEQRITLGGENETRTIRLSEGTWSYNCTGFFDSGDISIVGTVKSMSDSGAENSDGSRAAGSGGESRAADPVVINLSNNEGQKSLIHSSSFQAGDGQVLTLDIKSDIVGSVNLTLFSPLNEVQKITLSGENETRTISLSEGIWSYNCTGFFDSGDISIVGTVE